MKKSILRFMIPKSLVEYITLDSTVRQALEKMHCHKYTASPVLDSDGRYIGTLRNNDLLTYLWRSGNCDKESAELIPVSELLSKSYTKPLLHSASIQDLIECVKEHNFVPIVDDRGCFIGIVLRREILSYLSANYKE